MPEIMSKAQWLKLTDGGMTSVRSSELKKIDAALGEYEKAQTPNNLDALRNAVVAWIASKKKDWKKSIRNRYGAVETLFNQVMGFEGPVRTGQDMVALSHIRDESRAIITDLFRGAQLEWRPGILAKLNLQTKKEKVTVAYSGVSTARNINTLVTASGGTGFGTMVSSGGGGGSANVIKGICRSLIPPDIFEEAWQKLLAEVPTFLTDFAAEVTPFLGLFASGGSAIFSGIKAVRASYRVNVADEHLEGSLATGEPKKAIEALIRILERERNKAIADFGINTAAFAGKVASALADGGTATTAAIGLAATTAKLAVYLHAFVRDFRERKKVNLLMASGGILDGAELFDTSPITGCYMICCVPTSVMVNSIFARFYRQGWRGEVEYAVAKHIGPLREQAARTVREHRFWIPSLQNYPGLVEKNKKKLKEMAKRKGKTGMVGIGPDVERLDDADEDDDA